MLTLPIFLIVVLEIVALFSRLSISYMEIVVKLASLDYSYIQNFETQSFVLRLIFTNGKVDCCLCAFACELKMCFFCFLHLHWQCVEDACSFPL